MVFCSTMSDPGASSTGCCIQNSLGPMVCKLSLDCQTLHAQTPEVLRVEPGNHDGSHYIGYHERVESQPQQRLGERSCSSGSARSPAELKPQVHRQTDRKQREKQPQPRIDLRAAITKQVFDELSHNRPPSP